jgi:hypothetical protein
MNIGKVHFTLLLLLFALSSYFSSAQLPAVMLTDSAKVSLITCSQGEELYSIFGHSAIRVKDSTIGVDWVFNYGTFDFSDPKFYPNFVKGKLNYILSVSTYKNFEYTYIFEDRYVYEQILNLQQYEKQLLLDSLRINYLPQYRYYLYDFLFDNCATRIRDIFVETIPRTIEFDSSALKRGMTFRELLMPNVREKPWALLGINLLLGVSADRPAEAWEYMFLPEHMMTAFQHASFKTDSSTTFFAQPPTTLLEGLEIPRNRLRESPLYVFMALFLLTAFLTYKDVKRKRHSLWFDTILFGLVGLLGTVIAFQWFGSDHAVMANNFNIIWANPLHLIAIVMVFIKPLVRISKSYFLASMFLLIMLMIFWFFLPQVLPFSIFPLVASMAVRSVVVYKFA